jgi:flagellar biosynthesis protein FlhF
MHIKKFEARDLRQALDEIRGTLGPDAVILETSQTTGSSGGVTVLAALPREAPEAARLQRSTLPARLETAPASFPSAPAAMTATASRMDEAFAVARAEAALSSARADVAFSSMRDERVAPARFPTIERDRASASRSFAPPSPAAPTDSTRDLHERLHHLGRLVRSDHFSTIPFPLRQLYFDLTEAEVDADLVFKILQRMGSAPLPGQFTPAAPDDMLRLLRSLIQVGGAVEAAQPGRVVALVGPTGVGKTTTVAKIAGHAAFRLGLNVALVSSDAYRVFGAQHLASYAALMGLEFESVGSAAEMRTLLRGRFSRVDLVLIDTSGRSPRDPRGIAEIHQLLAACPDLDVHLVLAATSRARDLALALDAFSLLPVRHLIFTKLDEATSNGGIYTTALKARRPVSYLGTGQEVPDDLEPATLAAMTRGLDGGADA